MPYDPQLLAGLTTCHGLGTQHLAEFQEACVAATVPAGTLLMERGDEDRAMLFVREGELEVFVELGRSELIVRELHRGDFAGASGLLGLSTRRLASVRSRTTATLLVLERAAFEGLVQRGNPVVKNLEAQVLRREVAIVGEILATLAQLARGGPLPAPPPAEAAPGLFARVAASWRGAEPPRHPPPHLASEVVAVPSQVRGTLAETLEGALEPQRLRGGEVVVREGAFGEGAVLVLDGAVGIYVGSAINGYLRVSEAGPGSLCAFEGAVAGGPLLTTCVADEDCTILRLPHDLCADAVVHRTELAALLRRRMLEDVARLHGASSRVLVRGISRTSQRKGLQRLDDHPAYRRACQVTAMLA